LLQCEAEHFRAVTDPAEAGALLRAIRGDSSEIGRMACEFLALTFVRPSNAWQARWKDIDLDRALWTIPAEAMKMDREHVVPLSRQALAILRAMKQIGVRPYVFGVGKPLSRQTFTLLSERIGWADRHTAHGFRAMASTILHGPLGRRLVGTGPGAIRSTQSSVERCPLAADPPADQRDGGDGGNQQKSHQDRVLKQGGSVFVFAKPRQQRKKPHDPSPHLSSTDRQGDRPRDHKGRGR
jgi:hypothetical protein